MDSLLAYHEAARALGVSLRTVGRMVQQGTLKPVYRRMRAYIPAKQVDRVKRQRSGNLRVAAPRARGRE